MGRLPGPLCERGLNHNAVNQTVAPLADDPVIEDSVANRIAQKVSDEIDVKSLAQEGL